MALLTYIGIGVAVALLIKRLFFTSHALSHIPIVGGPDNIFGQVFGGIMIIFKADEIIREGYFKYNKKGLPFRIFNIFRGSVVVMPSETIPEFKVLNESESSFLLAICESLAPDLAMVEPKLQTDAYHIPLVRNTLTTGMAAMVPELENEVVRVFDEFVGPNLREAEKNGGDGWATLEWNVFEKMIARIANRTFLGAPFNRDPEYIDLCAAYTMSVVTTGLGLSMFPAWIRPFLARFMVSKNRKIAKRVAEILHEFITARIELYKKKKAGEDVTLPKDFLQALVNESDQHDEMNVHWIVLRLMVINFAAIKTTFFTFQLMVSKLVDEKPHHPGVDSYQEELRKELIKVYADEGLTPSPLASTDPSLRKESTGWTLAVINKLNGLDSFIGESMRIDIASPTTLKRIAPNGYQFKSCDIYLPPNTHYGVAGQQIHLHEGYPDGERFNGFRNGLPIHIIEAEMAAGLSPEGIANKYGVAPTRTLSTSTANNTYLAFGLGKHACPGRFFAIAELKLLLKELLLNYELKGEGMPRWCFFIFSAPDIGKSKVMFRRRNRV